MDPPHNAGRPASTGAESAGPVGLVTRLETWLPPALGAGIVLAVGLPWSVATASEFPAVLGLRLLLVLAGMIVAAGLILRVQSRSLQAADRLRSAEQSLRLLSEALLQSRRELEQRREAEQALRDADRSKDDFLATLCHELRNPLAAIDHAGELLGVDPSDEEQREWAVRIIRNQTRQLARLIDDLLDVSRIAAGSLALNLRPVSLPDLIRAAIDAARPFLEDAGQTVRLRLSDVPMWIEADPARLHQVLINLLSNACRYSDSGGTITVEADAEGPEVVVRIRDEGIGIDPALLPRVFDMFVRGQAARDRSPAGLGIGLRLVKLMIERHGGSIWAHSEGIGRGSEFELRLPRKQAPAAPLAEGEPPAAPIPLRLLIVDDNRPMVEALRLLLRRDGHEVRTARTGREALEAIAIDRPDLVLLDLELPDIDGIEVAQSVRRSEGPAPPPLVALTGSGRAADLERLRAAGIRNVIQKPVRIEELREVLSRAFREHAGAP